MTLFFTQSKGRLDDAREERGGRKLCQRRSKREGPSSKIPTLGKMREVHGRGNERTEEEKKDMGRTPKG